VIFDPNFGILIYNGIEKRAEKWSKPEGKEDNPRPR
jgi:hypothetical protein